MPSPSRFPVFARVGLLPALLALAVVLGLGSYAETSDDGSLAWLFAGVLSGRPVASVPLYLHGYGHLLAAAYARFPAVPWLGGLLAGLLLMAGACWFAVAERLLRPWLEPRGLVLVLVLVLVLLFVVSWLESWLWFSHARVAVLLAGSAVLYAAQRPGRWGPLLLGLLGLGAAWLLRPSLATLGFMAALPGAVLLAGSLRRAKPLLLGGALLIVAATGLRAATETPAEAQVRQRDTQLARILDYEQLRPAPPTPLDSLGTAAVDGWLFGDTALIDLVLRDGTYRFEAADFFGRTLPARLRLRLGLLGRDYFPLLLALLATAVAFGRRPPVARQRWFWLVQAGFLAGLLGLAGFFKLPPRLALPLLDFWLLTNLIFGLKPGAPVAGQVGAERPALPDTLARLKSRPVRWAMAVLALLVLLAYGLKTGHRTRVLRQEQRGHEQTLRALRAADPNSVRVLAGTNDLLKSLSPFRVADVGPGPVLQLTGWPAQDVSQAALRRALTGLPGQPAALARLTQPGVPGETLPVTWILTRPTARWLGRRRVPGVPMLRFIDQGPLAASADTALRRYRVQPGLQP
ncbi:MAG: hypothetical protein M3Y54_08110 [Bacteroidota bacterium]|nr:hypothetical protein [Bacteroidota bacterium]